MTAPDPARPSTARFPTTHWGRIIAAGGDAPEARDALAELCQDYWYPLYAFVRRKGYAPEDAQDLVQGLFTELLRRGSFQGLDPALGRFRSFLMACCTRHIAQHDARERAQKRGGGIGAYSIDRIEGEARFGASRPTTRRRSACSSASGP